MLVKPEQISNACFPIVWIEEGIEIDFNSVHQEKTTHSNAVIFDGS